MNRYDDQARLTFHYAREEANFMRHAQVGPEHLLLTLLRTEGGGFLWPVRLRPLQNVMSCPGGGGVDDRRNGLRSGVGGSNLRALGSAEHVEQATHAVSDVNAAPGAM